MNRCQKLCPVIHREGKYVFYFYTCGGNGPPHIYVHSGISGARYWLDPLDLAMSLGFNNHELKGIRQIIEAYREEFLELWGDYFRGQDN